MVFLEFRQEAWGSSGVATGISWNLSCSIRDIKTPFELQGGAQDGSQVSAGELDLISY